MQDRDARFKFAQKEIPPFIVEMLIATSLLLTAGCLLLIQRSLKPGWAIAAKHGRGERIIFLMPRDYRQ